MSQQIFSENEGNGVVTSGANVSYWTDSVRPIQTSPLQEDIVTHTVIVGAGISGLSVAYCLSKKGIPVVVVEDGFIGSGETGRTTAHITNALDDRYSEIASRMDAKTSRLAAESHSQAISFAERVVREENIDCDFKIIDGYLFLHPSDKLKTLEDELKATLEAGIQTEMLTAVPQINQDGPCLRFPRQAQFHPMKYLKGLAEAITKNGGKIFTETHVDKITKEGVHGNGHTVKASHIVVATNTPVNDLVTMHTKQHPYRTYVIGAAVQKGLLKPALWWDTGNMDSKWPTDPYHYVRLQEFNEHYDLLIAGGEDHKTGQTDEENLSEEDRFKNLIDWTQQKFPMIQDIVYRWSGQVMEPVDFLGFIGRNPGDKNIFIATGDSGNGMTHGIIAGMLISDLVLGIENPWTDIYSPSRITLKTAPEFLKEVGNMTKQYLDYFSKGDIESLNQLSPGDGAVLNLNGKKTAAYRDVQGTIHAYSAICPHLGCVLQWNTSEKSFDCPCHGSRFTCEGKVVNGPALTDLKKLNLQ
jgi:glycine/D-amino acid oxidase-like deaminating enzyme/nitrite reductase/ring-hydroxylating ferredoxin subunit